MRKNKADKPVPVPERQSSRIRGLPAHSPTVEAVLASNRPSSSSSTADPETEQALPGAPLAVQPLADPLLLVEPLDEAETARTVYYDSYLEALTDTELSYSELGPESDISFTSVPESEALLDAANLTLVGLQSTAIMTGPSFATIQQRYTEAFAQCEGHARKLPLTDHDLAEAKRILATLRDYLTQARAHLPEIGGLEAADPAVRLHNTISQFIQEAGQSITELTKDVEALQPPASVETRPRTDTGSQATKTSVWRKSLKRKVEAAKTALKELDQSIQGHGDEIIPRVRVQYFQLQLDRYRKFLEQDIPASVNKIEEVAADLLTEDEYDELLTYEDDVKILLEAALSSLTQAGIPNDIDIVMSTPNSSMVVEPKADKSQVSDSTPASNPKPPGRGYKVYRDGDYPKFKGDYEDYWSWRAEWVDWIIPGQDFNWVLRNLQRCTPAEDDLRIHTDLDGVWRYMDRKYANSLVVANEVLDMFLGQKKSEIPGRNEECKLRNLNLAVLRLRKQLSGVQEEQQLTENLVTIRHILKLMPDTYARGWTTSPESAEVSKVRALQGKRDVAGVMYENIMAYCDRVIDGLYENTPWLLEEANKGGRSGRKLNLFGAKGSKDPSDDSDAEEGSRAKHGGKDGKRGKKQDNSSEISQKVKDDQKSYGKCPFCSGYHTFKGNFGIQASTRVSECPEFNKLDVKSKAKKAVEKGVCLKCLSWRHKREGCPFTKFKCSYKAKDSDAICGKPHHRALHHCGDATVLAAARVKSTSDPRPDDILPAVVEVELKPGHKMLALLDPGSNSSLITHNAAKQLHLQGKFCVERVQLAGREEELQETAYYTCNWEVNGKSRVARFLGMNSITDMYGPQDVSAAYTLFPQYEDGELDRPEGDTIDILLGLDQADLLPGGGLGDDQVGNLRVMTTPLGSGRVLMGHHPSLATTGYKFSGKALSARHTTFLDRATGSGFSAPRSVNFRRCFQLRSLPEPGDLIDLPEDGEDSPEDEPQDFIEAEQLGVMVPRLCRSCASCLNCVINQAGPSVREKLEIELMKDKISYDPAIKRIVVSYPLIGEKAGFTINYNQVLGRAKSLWRSLKSKGALEAYQLQVRDYLKRGVWKETDWEQINAHHASGEICHFVAHNGVLNPGSLSTKLRIVVDSALKNPGNGKSINDVWTSPNTLNPLFETLVTFRSFPVGCVFDLSKAFHQIHTTKLEFFQRLCVWKEKEDEEWRVYGTDRVGMGDGPATGFLDLALNKAADMSRDIDPKAASDLDKCRYADDTLGGGTREECERMRGTVTFTEDGAMITDGTIAAILNPVSFTAKVIVLSGDKDPRILEKFGGKVLGVAWDPPTDLFTFKFDLNLTTKIRGRKTKGPTLTMADVDMVKDLKVTRRIALGVAHQLYDPFGLVATYVIKFKIRLRRLIMLDLGWDEAIPEEERLWWTEKMIEMIKADPITFPRSIWTQGAISKPELIAYFDGSDLAYGCLVYSRWPTTSGSWHTTILSSKAKVTPKAGCTTPRAELCALVLTSRLLTKLVPALDTKPCRISIIGDSTCTVSAVQLNVTGMKPFFSNRVLEIQDTLSTIGSPATCSMFTELTPEEAEATQGKPLIDLIYWIEGPKNPADWPSRGNLEWTELGTNTVYQKGPDMIRQNRSSWEADLSRDFVKEIPPEETKKQFFNVMLCKISELELRTPGLQVLISISNSTDNLTHIKGVFARLARAARLDDHQEVANTPDQVDYIRAMHWLAILSRDSTAKMIEAGQARNLCPVLSRGLFLTQGRIGSRAMSKALGHDQLVILANDSRLAHLLITQAHREDHRRSDMDALHRVRLLGFWIVRGRSLSKRITKSCYFCKRQDKQMESQRIGYLSEARTEPSYPFTSISCDYLGPKVVYDVIKKRTTMKVYPILFTCYSTGALHMELAPSYSTDDFLLAFARFTAIRGTPVYGYTDMGSNIVKAQKLQGSLAKDAAEDTEAMERHEKWTQIMERTASQGIQWRHAPSGGQHRDPSEAAVKMVKKTMEHLLKPGRLSYHELQTVLTRVADICNQRPLGIQHQSGAEPGHVVLTPNSLMKQMRTDHFNLPPEQLEENFSDRLTKRFKFQEEVIQQWWDQWFSSVFASLIPVRKWRSVERNVRPGDVALLKFPHKVAAADYRLCRVDEVVHDPEDGLVRTVAVLVPPKKARMISYPDKSITMTRMEVPIQRLAVFLPVEDQ